MSKIDINIKNIDEALEALTGRGRNDTSSNAYNIANLAQARYHLEMARSGEHGEMREKIEVLQNDVDRIRLVAEALEELGIKAPSDPCTVAAGVIRQVKHMIDELARYGVILGAGSFDIGVIDSNNKLASEVARLAKLVSEHGAASSRASAERDEAYHENSELIKERDGLARELRAVDFSRNKLIEYLAEIKAVAPLSEDAAIEIIKQYRLEYGPLPGSQQAKVPTASESRRRKGIA